jgi:hypothetical protein
MYYLFIIVLKVYTLSKTWDDNSSEKQYHNPGHWSHLDGVHFFVKLGTLKFIKCPIFSRK